MNNVKKIYNVTNFLQLEDNWDDEGAKAISIESVSYTIIFLLNLFMKNPSINIPNIYPNKNGSIDIDWETKNGGLVINVNSDGKGDFYADMPSGEKNSGVIDCSNLNIDFTPFLKFIIN